MIDSTLPTPGASDLPVLERHHVTITYLDQRRLPAIAPPPRPAIKTALMALKEPPLHFYRYLFDAVGRPHRWVSRRYLSDDALAEFVHAPDTTIYALYTEGWPSGFCEVRRASRALTEIKFFGLVPDVQGQRLGGFFLFEMLKLLWADGPERIALETCTLDNPAALRLYQRMGFTPYDQAKGVVEWRG